jgi:hypothetical protein
MKVRSRIFDLPPHGPARLSRSGWQGNCITTPARYSLHCTSPDLAHCRPERVRRHVRTWRKLTQRFLVPVLSTAFGNGTKVQTIQQGAVDRILASSPSPAVGRKPVSQPRPVRAPPAR